MYRSIESQRSARRIGLSLLALCLLVVLSGTARAEPDAFVSHSLNPMAQHSASNNSVLICGGQSARRVAGLLIRGADVAAIWRNTYRMLIPRSALSAKADENQSANRTAERFAHKHPAWGINLAKGGALLTVQTKW